MARADSVFPPCECRGADAGHQQRRSLLLGWAASERDDQPIGSDSVGIERISRVFRPERTPSGLLGWSKPPGVRQELVKSSRLLQTQGSICVHEGEPDLCKAIERGFGGFFRLGGGDGFLKKIEGLSQLGSQLASLPFLSCLGA